MGASSATSKRSGMLSTRSRIDTIAIGVSKNWASCHPSKPVRLMPSKRPPELQNRVQTIRAGTTSLSIFTPMVFATSLRMSSSAWTSACRTKLRKSQARSGQRRVRYIRALPIIRYVLSVLVSSEFLMGSAVTFFGRDFMILSRTSRHDGINYER